MVNAEVLLQLVAWTPFLLEGFAWNLLIAATAVILGTSVGVLLVTLHASQSPAGAACSKFVSQTLNYIPSFALMFYLAVLIPSEFVWPGSGELIQFPNWIKAGLALAVSPAAFTAYNFAPALARWERNDRGAALLFIPGWNASLFVTLIASSTASLVGVNEILSRSNKLIAASQNTELMVPLYLYVSLFFLGVCALITGAMKVLSRRLQGQSHP